MNIGYISIKSVWARPLSSLLSWLLFTFGVVVVILILLISGLLKSEISKNSRGIDLVVGAKGSPLQLILANVFHVDYPTGNISLKEAATVSRNRYIERAIPLSLGDSYRGYRIVGTTPAYVELFGAEISEGAWPSGHMGALVGSQVAEKLGLSLGSKFASQHGLTDDGDAHDHDFVVEGMLKSTGTVLDQLILTSVHAIWEVHSHEEGAHAHDSVINIAHLGLEVSAEEFENEEITALLVKYRSPMGAVMLPRQINTETNMQAASPAFEAARLFNIIGSGADVLKLLGLIIIIISGVSVFISLLNSLKDRKYEIAIMRSMGATRYRIFLFVLIEGIVITIFGILSGVAIAHVVAYFVASYLDGISTDGLVFLSEEWLVIGGCLVIGIIAATIPAFIAAREDISKVLAKG